VLDWGDGIFSRLWSAFGCIYEEELSKSGTDRVNVRCVLYGDVARMFRELESRGLIKSVREAVSLGITTYYEKVMERDLLESRAKTSAQLADSL